MVPSASLLNGNPEFDTFPGMRDTMVFDRKTSKLYGVNTEGTEIYEFDSSWNKRAVSVISPTGILIDVNCGLLTTSLEGVAATLDVVTGKILSDAQLNSFVCRL